MPRLDRGPLVAVASLVLLGPAWLAAQSRTRQECKNYGGSVWTPNANGRGGSYVWRDDIRCRTITEEAPAPAARRAEPAARRYEIERPAQQTAAQREAAAASRAAAARAADEKQKAATAAAYRAAGDAARSAGRAAPLLALTPEDSRVIIEQRMASVRHVFGARFRDIGLFTTAPRREATPLERDSRPEYAPDTIRETSYRIAVARDGDPVLTVPNVRYLWAYRTVLGEGARARYPDLMGDKRNTDAILSYRAVRCTAGSDTVGVAPPYGDVALAGRVVRHRTAYEQIGGLRYVSFEARSAFAGTAPEEYAIASVACNERAYASLPVVSAASMSASPMPVIFDGVVTMPAVLPRSAALVPVRMRGQRTSRRIGLARADTLLDGSRLIWVVVQHDSVVTSAATASCEPYRATDCALPYDAELRLERHRCTPLSYGDYGWGDSWFRPRLAARYLRGARVVQAQAAPYYADTLTGMGGLIPTSAPRAARTLPRSSVADSAEQGLGARAEICAALASSTPPLVTPVALRLPAAQRGRSAVPPTQRAAPAARRPGEL